MTRLIALFNLKPGIDAKDYENWARRVDIPTVNGLQSIEKFEVFKSMSLLGSAAAPPYQYVEIIDVKDMTAFGGEIATDVMKRVAAEFAGFADATFILTERLT